MKKPILIDTNETHRCFICFGQILPQEPKLVIGWLTPGIERPVIKVFHPDCRAQ